MATYYVYRHIRDDLNVPFYVGKGSKGRAIRKSYRSEAWNNVAKKTTFQVEIIIDGLTEKEAYLKEDEFIKLYKKHGYCEANISEGATTKGIPCSEKAKEKIRAFNLGKKRSPESILKTSLSLKGRIKSDQEKKNISKSLIGHKHSEETKKKIAIKAIGRFSHNRIQIIDMVTGCIWDSLRKASLDNNINYTLLSSMLSGAKKNKTNLRRCDGKTKL